jgi:hypothetical protein
VPSKDKGKSKKTYTAEETRLWKERQASGACYLCGSDKHKASFHNETLGFMGDITSDSSPSGGEEGDVTIEFDTDEFPVFKDKGGNVVNIPNSESEDEGVPQEEWPMDWTSDCENDSHQFERGNPAFWEAPTPHHSDSEFEDPLLFNDYQSEKDDTGPSSISPGSLPYPPKYPVKEQGQFNAQLHAKDDLFEGDDSSNEYSAAATCGSNIPLDEMFLDEPNDDVRLAKRLNWHENKCRRSPAPVQKTKKTSAPGMVDITGHSDSESDDDESPQKPRGWERDRRAKLLKRNLPLEPLLTPNLGHLAPPNNEQARSTTASLTPQRWRCSPNKKKNEP